MAWCNLTCKWGEEKQDESLKFLYDNKILTKVYRVFCDECKNEIQLIEEKDLDIYKKVFELKKNEINLSEKDYSVLCELEDKLLQYLYCDECDNETYIDINKITASYFYYKKIKDRDKSLDNV